MEGRYAQNQRTQRFFMRIGDTLVAIICSSAIVSDDVVAQWTDECLSKHDAHDVRSVLVASYVPPLKDGRIQTWAYTK
jgi:hypothetical protein